MHFIRRRFYAIDGPCLGPSPGRLGKTPTPNFHICLWKCPLVRGYCIGISQPYLVSQLETLISEHADFHFIKEASVDISVSS